jgi:hypothetical protein
LSGFSSNSSVQTVQILIGKAIYAPSYDDHDAPRKWSSACGVMTILRRQLS